MSKRTEGDKKCREAAKTALERAFVFSRPLDSIAQARALIEFLQDANFPDGEPTEPRAMYGYGLILALINILLDQAHARVELEFSRENLPVENLKEIQS